MKRFRRYASHFHIVLGACLVVCHFNLMASPLVVEPETVDVGALAPGDSVVRSFEIENIGTGPVAFEFPGFAQPLAVGSDLELTLGQETFTTLEFRAPVDGPLSGDWTGFSGTFELSDTTGGSWASDLALLLTSTPELDFSAVVYQAGGSLIQLAPPGQAFPWTAGADEALIDESFDFPEPIAVDGLYLWIGNAGVAGNGTWDGTISLFGLGGQTDLVSDIDPLSGELAPGERVSVEATLDAGPRLPGVYEEALVLITDQAEQPELAVPVRLTVTAEATLAPLPPTLDFGEVVVGATRSQVLTIDNTGNAALNLADIAVSGQGFSVAEPSLEVAPFSKVDLTIFYSPDELGTDSGELSFSTNDSNAAQVAVSLSGTGIAAPAISLDPASIELNLAAGDQGSVSFDIVNSGEGPLNFSLPSFADSLPAGPLSIGPVVAAGPVGASRSGSAGARGEHHGHSNWQAATAMTGGGEPPYSIEFDEFAADAGDYQLIDGPLAGELATIVADFVLDSSTGETFASDLTLLIASTPTPDLQGGDDVLIQIGGSPSLPHPVFAGWGSGNSSSPGTEVQAALQATVPIELDEVYVLLGNGWIQGSGTWSGSIELGGLTSAVGPIVGADPVSGTVAPGESATIQLDVSAVDLVQGSYTGRLQINSNDPLQPLTEFELALEVSGTPGLTLAPNELDFGELFIGQLGSLELVVSNTGSAPLALSEIELNDTRFEVAAESVTVEPGQSVSLPVSFVGVSAGEVSATLAFQSNDPDNSTVSVPLSATVLETPALAVEPAEIEAALAAGESTTVSLALSNPGNGLLEFEFPDFVGGGRAESPRLAGPAAGHSRRARLVTSDAVDAQDARGADSESHSNAAPLSDHAASLEIELDGFAAFGGEFVPAVTDLSGELARIDADFVLDQSTGLTWASDLALVITQGPDLTPDSILLQVGGTFSLAPHGRSLVWGSGSSSEPGTTVQTSIILDEPLNLTEAQVWLGNAWVPDDRGEWSGTIGLDGVTDGTAFITEVDPSIGQLAAGESTAVEVTLSAIDLVAGSYRDRLRLISNDPGDPSRDITAELTVSGLPELVIAPGSLDFGTVFSGSIESASVVL